MIISIRKHTDVENDVFLLTGSLRGNNSVACGKIPLNISHLGAVTACELPNTYKRVFRCGQHLCETRSQRRLLFGRIKWKMGGVCFTPFGVMSMRNGCLVTVVCLSLDPFRALIHLLSQLFSFLRLLELEKNWLSDLICSSYRVRAGSHATTIIYSSFKERIFNWKSFVETGGKLEGTHICVKRYTKRTWGKKALCPLIKLLKNFFGFARSTDSWFSSETRGAG